MNVNAAGPQPVKHPTTALFQDFSIDQLKPKKVEKFLQALLSSQQSMQFSSPEIYSKFLESLTLKKAEFADKELYQKTLLQFRKTLGLPENVGQQDVMLSVGEKVLFSCPKELLTSLPYYQAMLSSGMKESESINGKYKITLPLSEQAAQGFKSYLYTGHVTAVNGKALSELLEYAHLMHEQPFIDQVTEKYIAYLVDPKHENEFEFDHAHTPISDPKEFVKLFLEKRNIAAKIYENKGIEISLTDFLSLFQKKDSKIHEFVAREIDTVRVDTPESALLYITPKKYRKQILDILLDDVNKYDMQHLNALLTHFPNAYFGLNNALEEKLRNAIKLDPNSAIAHAILGSVLTQSHRFKQAEPVLREAIKLDPKHAFAHAHLGIVLGPKLGESETELREAIRLNPKSALAHRGLGEFLINSRKLEEAETMLRKAIKLNPKDAFAHGRLGDVFRQRDKLKEAETELREAIRLDPKSAVAHKKLGVVMMQRDKLEEAEMVLREAIKLDPKDTFASLDVLGTVLQKRGKLEEAETVLREVIRLNPKSALAHRKLAVVMIERDKLEEAETALRKAIELNPKGVIAYAKLGEVLGRRDRLEEAETVLQEAIRLDPKWYLNHRNLGLVMMQRGKLEEAETALREAIKLDPKDTFAHVALGELLKQRGKLEGAETELQEAIKLDPKDAATHGLLGDVLRLRGKLEEAETVLKEAVKLDPNFLIAHQAPEEVLKQKDELEKAKEQL